MPTLLVIDDEPPILHLFRALYRGSDVEVLTAAQAGEGIDVFTRQRPDAVILDVDLPDLSGLEVFLRLREIDARVPVIFLTGHATTGTAIEAMACGAFDYQLKPFSADEMRRTIARAMETARLLRSAAGSAAADEAPPETLVGRGAAMQEVYKSIGRIARSDVPVLVLGESGTGKELVARAVWQYSRRADRPFLAINCAAIPEALLESELFGYEKGAFTGADRPKAGRFEQCDGGTLFLDEVGDMPLVLQGKLLRVLQDQQVTRVGGETRQVDVRLVAATNRDLRQMVHAGLFRGDLYYRLNVYTIPLPSLRERPDDLPMLVEHFLKRFRPELGRDVAAVAPEAMELLRRHPWPGNVRELQSVLKQAIVRAAGPLLLPEHIAPLLDPQPAAAQAHAPVAHPELDEFVRQRLEAGSQNLYAECLARIDAHLFGQVLRYTQGNLSQAARILGIHRATLRSRAAELGVHVEGPTAVHGRGRPKPGFDKAPANPPPMNP